MRDETSHELSGDIAVVRSADVAAPVEEVWRHLSDGDLLSAWMDSPVEIDPRPGGRISMTPDGGQPVWGTVEEVIPGRRIQWAWRSDDGMPTLVEIEIEADRTGTRFTVRETLLPWETDHVRPTWLPGRGPHAEASWRLLAAA